MELDFPNDSLSVGTSAMRLENTAMPTNGGHRFDQASSVCLYCHSAFSRDSGVNGADEWPVNGLQPPRLWTDCSPPHLGRYKSGTVSGITPSPRAPYRVCTLHDGRRFRRLTEDDLHCHRQAPLRAGRKVDRYFIILPSDNELQIGILYSMTCPQPSTLSQRNMKGKQHTHT